MPVGGDGRWIIHVDMDAFYAAVERRDNPALAGKPVIVGADPRGGRGRGVVAACSYEARAFGLRSAMPISRAFRLCPQGIYLRPRMARYEEVSRRIFTILRSFTDLVEPLSIDEAFLDVTSTQRLFGPAPEIARAIKDRIRREEALVASVGVAPTKFVAKVASDLGKPDGFVVVRSDEVRRFLDPLPLSRLWGVGPRTEGRLHALGLRTIGDVARRGEAELTTLLGSAGREIWNLARGIDDREVVPWEAPKSLGAETTFAEDTDDAQVIRRTLLELADRVAQRLRREGYSARAVTLKYRTSNFATVTRAAPLPEPTQVGADLFRMALALLERVPRRGMRVRLLGIAATKLEPVPAGRGQQLALFAGPGGRASRLAAALDVIEARFGPGAISRASLAERGASRPRPRKAGSRSGTGGGSLV